MIIILVSAALHTQHFTKFRTSIHLVEQEERRQTSMYRESAVKIAISGCQSVGIIGLWYFNTIMIHDSS